MRQRSFAELEQLLDHLRAAPRDVGVLELVVARPGISERRILNAGALDTELGLLGDSWSVRPGRGRPDRTPDPERQVTVMSHRMVALLAHDPAEQALAGDQLYVDLDLSLDHLPTGSRVSVGTAVLEVTAPPHRGCPKFVRAFGKEAMQFVNSPTGRSLRLRGLNARVVEPGTVRPGDTVAALEGVDNRSADRLSMGLPGHP